MDTLDIRKGDMDFRDHYRIRIDKTNAKRARMERDLGVLSCFKHDHSETFNTIEAERQGAELQQSQQQLLFCAAILPNGRWSNRQRPVEC